MTAAILSILRDISALVGPAMNAIAKYAKDREVRSLTRDLRSAKTPDEKRDIARRIADALYKL